MIESIPVEEVPEIVSETFAPRLEPEPPSDVILNADSSFEMFIGDPTSNFEASDVETVVDLGNAQFL